MYISVLCTVQHIIIVQTGQDSKESCQEEFRQECEGCANWVAGQLGEVPSWHLLQAKRRRWAGKNVKGALAGKKNAAKPSKKPALKPIKSKAGKVKK